MNIKDDFIFFWESSNYERILGGVQSLRDALRVSLLSQILIKTSYVINTNNVKAKYEYKRWLYFFLRIIELWTHLGVLQSLHDALRVSLT